MVHRSVLSTACQKQLVDWPVRTGKRSKGYRDVRSVQEEGQNVWEGEECRKSMGTDCQRVFLEAPACLTHSFSHRGPMCVVASSGLAHDGNTKDTDWKWNTCLCIKEAFLEFGTFAQSLIVFVQIVTPSGADLDSLRALFVVFGWVSALCALALALVHNLLRPHINTAAHVASVVCVGGDPCHPDGTYSVSDSGSSGSLCGLPAIRPVVAAARRLDKHGMDADEWLQNIGLEMWPYMVGVALFQGKGRDSMGCVFARLNSFPWKPILAFTWCCWG